MPRPPHLQHVTPFIRSASTARVTPTRRLPPLTQYQYKPAKARSQQPTPSSHPPPPKYPARAGRTGRILTGALGGALALWILLLAKNALKQTTTPLPNPRIADLDQQRDVTSRYDDKASSYDSDVWLSEWLMGITRKRKRLARMCKGNVLEVGCGTGRNLGFFDVGAESEVETLTFVDLSPKMVEICRRKWDVLYGDAAKLKPGLRVRFLAASALENLPPPPSSSQMEGQKYDTILQTLALCSTPSPVTLLTNLATHLNPSNPDARILLLEHGRSYRDWLNRIIDASAEKHAEEWGCWANREIGALVAEAAEKAGLEVVRERRWHLGTTWVVELKFPRREEGSGEGEREGGGGG